MKAASKFDFSLLLSDRTRLKIMAFLASAAEPIDFRTMLEKLELSKGNLSSHTRKLEEAGFIKVTKRFIDRKPLTSFEITKSGREEVKSHLQAIERALRAAL